MGDESELQGWVPDEAVVPAVTTGRCTAADLSSPDVHWAVVVMSRQGLSVLQIAGFLQLSVRWVKRIRADTTSAILVTLLDERERAADLQDEVQALREALIARDLDT